MTLTVYILSAIFIASVIIASGEDFASVTLIAFIAWLGGVTFERLRPEVVDRYRRKRHARV